MPPTTSRLCLALPRYTCRNRRESCRVGDQLELPATSKDIMLATAGPSAGLWRTQRRWLRPGLVRQTGTREPRTCWSQCRPSPETRIVSQLGTPGIAVKGIHGEKSKAVPKERARGTAAAPAKGRHPRRPPHGAAAAAKARGTRSRHEPRAARPPPLARKPDRLQSQAHKGETPGQAGETS